MYRFQGGGNRSNGIYCEPDTNAHQHHFSPSSHGTNKKMSSTKNLRPHHHAGRNGNGRGSGGSASIPRGLQGSTQGHLPHRSDHDSEIDSSSEVSDGPYAESENHGGINLQNRMNINHQQNGGIDSPPEPAPSDLPLRMNGGFRPLKPNYERGDDMDSEHYHNQPTSGVYLPQEYLMSSPYQPKSPLPIGTSLATAKKLFQSDNLQNETADSNSTLSTLPSQARLIGGGPLGNNGMLSGMPSAPVILPVFPSSTPHPGQLSGGSGLPSARSLPRNHYSPSRFTLQKDCRVSDRCSWKCVSVALILLCVALISILIYFAVIMGNCSRFPGTGCIVVEDAKVMARGEKHFPVMTDHTSVSPRSSEVEMVSPTSLVPQATSSRGEEDGLSPAELYWGQPLSRRLEPYSYWTLEMTLRDSGYVNLNITFPWATNWALLFRRNALPSVTQHDFIKVIKNGRLEGYRSRTRRHHYNQSEDDLDDFSSPHVLAYRSRRETSIDPTHVILSEYLENGKWFLRVLNDNPSGRRIQIISQLDTNAEVRCPQQCSGNGNCVYGKCHCFDGFSGIDCATSLCPVLCSSHGRYGGGLCHCDSGWKGVECDILESECEIGNCHGNGNCVNGNCVCKLGWTGSACQNRGCSDPTCSNHGTCVDGRCLCEVGWAGNSCSFPESFLSKCLPDCSGRGEFEVTTGKCNCEKPYGGPNCLEVICDKDCGLTGFCSNTGQCQCKEGWSGDNCDALTCDTRCAEHGQCKNGTCICSVGWNGKHCTLAGCPNSCTHSDHGSCIMQDVYFCKCKTGWAGADCSIRLETNCADEVDNDEDGMTDCSDSECCENPACKEHLMCMTANDPVEVLLRKQPPSVTASFFQRVKFLIDEESVQSYAQKDEYWESHFWSSFEHRRVAVIRGQVLSADGLGIVGIRVSVDKSQRLGFTLTRKGGWFDMLVNGGGSVTLQFQRNPFRPLTRTVFAPWNEIVVLDPPVIMSVGGNHMRDLSQDEHSEVQQAPCHEHNLDLLNPIVMSSWFPEMVGGNPNRSFIFGETQILQESIGIPGSGVHLLYHSSQSSGYLATILMQLTGSQLPPGLILVHLKITVEGELYKRTFEADPNITYTFGWRKRNVYQQKVYGLASARVAIGYEYSACSDPIWTLKTVTLKGYDVDIADVGGWNLDIHHHYNFHEGILQKGDGSEVHLKEMPRLVKPLLGIKGQQRSLLCDPCDNTLLSPVALTTGPDGSLYVGDFNLIRRILPDNQTYTILQLSATKVSHQYFMAISPADGHLYISDPEKYQVLRVNKMDDVGDPRVNWSPVIGTGLKCVPGDPDSCGDGLSAKLAKLNHPKGLAVTSSGAIYLADGPNIRYVNSYGIIHTLVGKHNPWTLRGIVKTSDFEACLIVRQDATKVQLHWPTNLALNLVESKLFFIDEGHLFQLTRDNQVERVLKCDVDVKIIRPIIDVGFSPKGQLFFLTEDSQLYTLKSEGKAVLVLTDYLAPYYGPSSTGEGSRNNLDAGAASALSIGADSTIYVADQAHLEVKQISAYLPPPNVNGDYEVVFPATGEVYIFNRYGQHTLTRDLKSGRTIYSFLYTKNTSYGKLSKISDGAENKILFLRDYSSAVSTIENTQGKKSTLRINRLGRLTHFQELENSDIRLEYSEDGLLVAKLSSRGVSALYFYDGFGRVKRVIGPTGVIHTLDYALSGRAVQLRVQDSVRPGLTYFQFHRDDTNNVLRIQRIDEYLQASKSASTDVRNGSYTLETDNGYLMVGMSRSSYPLLRNAKFMKAPSIQHLFDPEFPPVQGNKQEWKYGLLGPERLIDRQLWINDTRILSLEFDSTMSREIIYNQDREPILSVQYDRTGSPLTFSPKSAEFSATSDHRFPLNISYDRFNRVEKWKWGRRRGEQLTYDRNGFATEVRNLDNVLLRTIEYNDQGLPSKITLNSSRTFAFAYDIAGGLRWIETPKGTRHSFSSQHSVGFTKVVYQPPGYNPLRNAFVKHYNGQGQLSEVWLPPDCGRILYEFDYLKRVTQVLYSEGKLSYKYRHQLTTISSSFSSNSAGHNVDLTRTIQHNKMGQTIQEKQEFGSKSGFASAMFLYEYDTNFRPILIKSRVGGHPIDFPLSYSAKTGGLDQIGNFRITRPGMNESSIFDGVAIFSRSQNGYGQPLQYSLTIQAMEVFRIDYTYSPTSARVHQMRVVTKTAAAYTEQTYAPLRNYTFDVDGQLIAADAVDPWKFEYDGNGNLKALTYRGNKIALEYNQQDQILRFADGIYKYDCAGRVIHNANEEYFSYNSLGQLKRASKRGRFDIEYFYDDEGRLVGRKDNHGNITQYFYADVVRRELVTHIYNPKENRLLHFVYDDDKRLIFFQVNRGENYYVATDHLGTPLLAFNQYGLLLREVSRSPFGHIVYDSDPTFYLPIDFAGGILDKVTLLVHTREKRVYDPLIGQFLTPNLVKVEENLQTPEKIQLYRLNGNDPINPPPSTPSFDHETWLRHLGYDVESLSPQLFQDHVGLRSKSEDIIVSGLESRILEKAFDTSLLETVRRSQVAQSTLMPNPGSSLSQVDPPLGKNILLSRTGDGKGMISACPFCTSNRVDRDVFTQILNGSEFLSYVSHSPAQDVFHFVKKELWKASDDLADLKRLEGLINVTVHDRSEEKAKGDQTIELKIHLSGALIFLKYGTTGAKEEARLLHHAKATATRKAWALLKDSFTLGIPNSDFTSVERENILKNGHLTTHHPDFMHDPEKYTIFADDPLNVKFLKKSKSPRNRNSNNHAA